MSSKLEAGLVLDAVLIWRRFGLGRGFNMEAHRSGFNNMEAH
jgi:hypothetical protein